MRQPGIYGPYQHRNRWRIVVVGQGGGSVARSYGTKEEADRAKNAAEAKLEALDGITVTKAIDQYEAWQKARGLKENTYETARQRLTKFLADVMRLAVGGVTPARAKNIYDGWVMRSPVDTHRNMLGEAKMFFGWCVAQGWIKRSPFADVKGVGKKRKGKAQLRFDEARKWYATALEMAPQNTGALAAICTLVFGQRASEVAKMSVRDLDDGGRLIWVADSKTEAGKRTLEVPDELHPLLQQLASGKAATDPLFGPGRTRYWVYYWVQRVCDLARVQKVCAHAMRGLHGTTAVEHGATPKIVAAAMGHTSPVITERHYLKPGTTARATQRAALSVLAGGRK